MAECAVVGCSDGVGEMLDLAGVHYPVCSEHELALRSGEHFSTGDRAIFLGDNSIPVLLGLTSTLMRGNPSEVIEITLGRNGLATSTLTFQLPEGVRLEYVAAPNVQ